MARLIVEAETSITGSSTKKVKFPVPDGKYLKINGISIDTGIMASLADGAGVAAFCSITVAANDSVPNPDQNGFLHRTVMTPSAVVPSAVAGTEDVYLAPVSKTDGVPSFVTSETIWIEIANNVNYGDQFVYLDIDYEYVSLSDIDAAVLAWTQN